MRLTDYNLWSISFHVIHCPWPIRNVWCEVKEAISMRMKNAKTLDIGIRSADNSLQNFHLTELLHHKILYCWKFSLDCLTNCWMTNLSSASSALSSSVRCCFEHRGTINLYVYLYIICIIFLYVTYYISI